MFVQKLKALRQGLLMGMLCLVSAFYLTACGTSSSNGSATGAVGAEGQAPGNGPNGAKVVRVSDEGEDFDDMGIPPLEAGDLVHERIKATCRNGRPSSCEILAREALSDYDYTGDYGYLRSAILMSSMACDLNRSYCLLKGDLLYRAYTDGLDIETWLPGRYIREEIYNAYKKATYSNDLVIAASAYHGLGLAQTAFKDKKNAVRSFDMSCKMGGAPFCLKSGSELASGSKKDAIAIFREGCELNGAQSCLNLGDLLYSTRQYTAGKKAYAKACDLNLASACNALAFREQRAGKVTNARDAFQRSCALGYAESCSFVGSQFSAMGNSGKAFASFARGCELGNSDSCFYIATKYRDSHMTHEAINAFQRACDAGHAQACYELSLMNNENSITIYQRGCELGNKQACYTLAGEYKRLYKDREAEIALDKACTLGLGIACEDLANGMCKDCGPSGAILAYVKACELKSGSACVNAARLQQEQGKAADAVKSNRKGCELKEGRACYNLAVAYSNGQGVKRNQWQANKYFKQACELGEKDACFMASGSK